MRAESFYLGWYRGWLCGCHIQRLCDRHDWLMASAFEDPSRGVDRTDRAISPRFAINTEVNGLSSLDVASDEFGRFGTFPVASRFRCWGCRRNERTGIAIVPSKMCAT